MPRIKTYKRLDPLQELGGNAELFIDSICLDISDMNIRDMMIIYEPDIVKASEVILKSEEVGNWKWNCDRKKWEKVTN